MSLDFALEDDKGNVKTGFEDLQNDLIYLIEKSLLSRTSDCPRLLDYIDEYGTTLFNTRQFSQLSKELEELQDVARNDSDRRLIANFQRLVEFAERKANHFIRIVGD